MDGPSHTNPVSGMEENRISMDYSTASKKRKRCYLHLKSAGVLLKIICEDPEKSRQSEWYVKPIGYHLQQAVAHSGNPGRVAHCGPDWECCGNRRRVG